MKKYVLIMFPLLFFTLLLSSCSQSEEEKIQDYLEVHSKNFYEFSVVNFIDGKLNIEFKMLPDYDSMSNDDVEFDVRVETKQALEAIEKYSIEQSEVVEEVNLSFVTRETNKTVAEISANNDTLSNTEWRDVTNHELPQHLDSYEFQGISN